MEAFSERIQVLKLRDPCEGLQEFIRVLITDYPSAVNLLSLPVKKYDAGRAEQFEALQHCPIVGVIRCYIDLQQHHFCELGVYSRIGESEALHFYARDTPVRVKI